MDNKILKFYKVEIKEVNDKDFTLSALVSTKKQDRDGDVILPDAFDKRLKYYKEHPILLSSHDYRDLRKQIGEAVSVKVTDTGLEAKFKYYVDEGNEEANWAWNLAQKGIASYSIGFMAYDFEWIEDKDEAGNKVTTGRKFKDVELLEISQVLIPSNRGALQMGRNLAQEEVELCEMALKSFGENDFPKMKVEQKPKPQEGESRDDFMDRCIPILINEGKDKEQAVAICNSLYDENKTTEHYSEKLLEQGLQTLTVQQEQKPVDVNAVKETVNQYLKKENK